MLNFKMNIPGVYINNSNWKHILNATHIAVMSIFTLFPLFYIVISWISSTLWEKINVDSPRHDIHYDKPEQFSEIMIDFLDKVQ